VKIVAQRRSFDCAVAALAFYCGLPYEDVYVAAARTVPGQLRRGMWVREIISTARRLGRRLSRTHWRQVDLEESAGVLMLSKRQTGHAVVLRNGLIIDPEGPTILEADEYLKLHGWRVGTLLVEKETR
jgi:ABC-type bacteriocin/lantibiotic exporter with double-glycine peptidase domain